jgi:hypothetical protein
MMLLVDDLMPGYDREMSRISLLKARVYGRLPKYYSATNLKRGTAVPLML